MFVFYNPQTLEVEHVVLHAPEGYRDTIQGHNFIETDEDIPPEEIIITDDKRVIRGNKAEKKGPPSVIELIIMKGQADKQIDAMAFIDNNFFMLSQKYAWATSNPMAKAIEVEAKLKGFTPSEMAEKIKSDYQAASFLLQKAELNRIKARLAIHVAPDAQTVQHVLNTFDPAAEVEGL